MARLKGLLRSAVEDRSPRFLWGTIALGVVVSLIAGFAIGYKVEESRRAPVKKVAKPAKSTTAKPTGKPKIVSAPPLIGAVFKVTKNQLIVLDKNRKAHAITVGAGTRFAVAGPGKGSDIVVGTRVFFQPTTGSATKAGEVGVLPGTARTVTPVTAVARGTSMTLRNAKGAGTVITVTGAKVDKTAPGTRGAALKQTRVIVQYFLVGPKKRATAVQVVVLPKTATFR